MDKLEHWIYKIKMFFKKLSRRNSMIRRPRTRSDPHLGVLSR
jgi:hypothetical protein